MRFVVLIAVACFGIACEADEPVEADSSSDSAFSAIEISEDSSEIIHHRAVLHSKFDGRNLMFLILRKHENNLLVLEVPVALGSAENGMEQGNFVIVGREEQSKYSLEATYSPPVSGGKPNDVRHYVVNLPPNNALH